MMEGRIVVLLLVLQYLGIDPDIKTLANRLKIQNAIYLAQRAGVDLGYSFGWYPALYAEAISRRGNE